MQSINDLLFGPLSPQYCNCFFVLMVISFVGLVVTVVGGLGFLLSAKKTNGDDMAGLAALIFNGVIIYFVIRLMYNMCLQSVGVHYHA